MSIQRLVQLLFLSLFFTKNRLASQCPITVNAGADVLVCDVGNMATLNGSIIGQYLGFVWSPATGLNNPNILNPTVTVSGPATYTLTAQAVDPSATNMVTNPGFESGNSGFTSAYTYNPLPITPGTYVLTTSPSLVLSSFPPCDDHTFGNGTGNMMLINGNASNGAQVWCQTINVMPNTWYVMSAWAMASPISPPSLQFSVNSTPLGAPYPVGTGTCNWQQFSASWYAGSATTATLCILDQISGGNGFFGDDYALDDIFFAPACTVNDEVMVDVANIQAVVPVTAFLLCNAGPAGIQLNGSGSSSGPGITYLWTGPGIIGGANTPIATVHEVGNYTLTVTLNIGMTNCQVSASLDVQDDPNSVIATASANDLLNCTNPIVQLDGTGSSLGNTVDYNWEPASAVVSGQGTLMPEVNQAGLYTLTVTNSVSGCTATATAIVNQNTTQPTAMAAAPNPLSCTVFETLLNGTGSSTGNNFSYQWTGPGIVAGDMTLNGCLVNLPGSYILTVTNETNGCTTTATTTLTTNAAPPTASATASGNLNCNNATASLGSTGSSSGPNISLNWTTTNGHFVGSANGPTATVDSAGVYVLTVTNTSNGCSATASVSVSASFAQPTASIATPVPALNCLTDSVRLDASQSSSGAGFGLVWASQNGGTFLSGQASLMPWVGSAGTYLLTVTDSTSGCTASTSATVVANTTPPIAQAGQNATLDCSGTAIQLDGSGSSTGSGFSYQWTTPGGNILSGDTTLMPEVDGVGAYFLLVENAANGCTAIDSVAVGQDANAPTVVIAPASQLDCDTDEITLDAAGSSAGANITLTWSGPGFVSGQNTLMPTVELPGIYSLTLLNQNNNCEATASVTVVQDVTPPLAAAGPAPDIEDCNSWATEVLDGSGSSQGGGISYLWSNGDTSLTTTVNYHGTYYLTVTNSNNGCSNIDSVVVTGLDTLPPLTIVIPDTLSCAQNEIQITVLGNLIGDYILGWERFGGDGIVSGGGTLTPIVNLGGYYTLQIFNENTGCVFHLSTQVAQSDDVPLADAGAVQYLGCGAPSVFLDGSASSSGANITYAWTTANGTILSGATTLSPEVGEVGIYTLTATDTLNGCFSSDDVLVGFLSTNSLIADAGLPQTLLCGQASLQLNGAGSSTGAGFIYLWTTQNGNILNGDSTLVSTVNAPGLYTLTVTDTQNGCSAMDDMLVGQDANAPVANAGAPQSLTCAVVSATLDGTGSSTGPNISYLWTTTNGTIFSGETTLSPVVTAAGTYLLTVTNTTNNCQSLASVLVNANSTPPVAVAAAPQSLDCLAQQVTLSGTGSSSGAGFGYLWMGPGIVSGATTLAPVVAAPGVYTLTVSSSGNGCTATASVTLNQTATPPIAVAAAPQSLDCLAQQVNLSGTGSSSGAGFGYLWTGPGIVSGATTLAPLVAAPGVYTLTVSNSGNGCTATASVTLNQTATPPVAVAAAPQSLDCLAQQVNLSGTGSSAGAGFGYLWTGPGIVSGATTLSPLVNMPGVYTLTVTDSGNGCTATAQTTVVQNITTPVADAGPPATLVCGQSTLTLQGSSDVPNSALLWTTVDGSIVSGEATASPNVGAAGTYILEVTNPANGCAAIDSVVVTEEQTIFPAPEIELPTCANPLGSISFSATALYFYSINNGVDITTSGVFEGLQPGDYTVTIYDAIGCETSVDVSLPVFSQLAVNLTANATVVAGTSVQLSPVLNVPAAEVASVAWLPTDGLSCTDCLSPTASPGSDIIYTVTVTNLDGCTATAFIAITVALVEATGGIFVPNAFSPNDDGLNDVLTVFADENLVKQVVSFQVFSRWGEAVFAGFGLRPNDVTLGWDGSFRGKKVDLGVYVWFAEVELATGERRLLKGDVVLIR